MGTNPPPGGPAHDPVPAGPHGADPHGDFVPAGPTHNLGYEPDQFGLKTILVVPAAVIGTAFGAFVVTWIVFATVFDPRINNPEPTVPEGARQNAASLNERLGRISSTDTGADFQQPRLEGLQKTQVYYKDGNPQNKSPDNVISTEMITTQPAKDGNSPRFHAEDLRPDRVRELNSYGVRKETGQAWMPVTKAMEMAVDGGLLPAQPGARRLDIEPNPDRPRESNAGRGRAPEPAAPSAKKGPDEKKEPDKKAEEKKGPEDKKEPEKKGPTAEKK